MLSFFPRGVLDEILNLIESVSKDFPSYSASNSVVYTSINFRKNKLIAYIYIRFNQNLDEKSYISANIEAVSIYTHFLLSAEQRRRLIRL